MPKNAAAPTDIDLAGQWRLRPESVRDQPRIGEAIDRTDGVDQRKVMRQIINERGRYDSGRSGKSRGGLVGIFLETGDLLKITQTPHALFISFDRAVVEEYRFGENRPVSVGQADAHRVSGWEGDSYVIETLGENRMKLTDRYHLDREKQRLVRQITLRSRQKEEVTIIQEFERQED